VVVVVDEVVLVVVDVVVELVVLVVGVLVVVDVVAVVLVVVDVVVGVLVVVVLVVDVVVVLLVVVVLGVVVVVVVVDVVVEVLEPTGQRGRPASPVQVQRNALHCFVMFFAQLVPLALGPHASLISSLQAVFLSHLPLSSAIAEEERKTPTPSATAANNLTTAFLVIVEPPIFSVPSPSPRSIRPLDHCVCRSSTRLSRRKVSQGCRRGGRTDAEKNEAPGSRRTRGLLLTRA